MATSGTVDYSQTFRQIATGALDLIGAVQDDTPSGEDMARAFLHCNLMLKTWGTKPRLWLMTEGSVTLTAGTASYSVPLAHRITSVRRLTTPNEIPLRLFSRQEYFDQPNKTAQSTPTQYYFDPQCSTRTLYIWPTANPAVAANTTLPYTYVRVIEDIDALDDDFDLPQEWLEVIMYGLAARLTLPYRTAMTNPSAAQKVEERAAALYGQLSAYDDEDASVYLQPGYQ